MREFSQFIHNWEDATELGRAFRQGGDEVRYDLGDLAFFVTDPKNGRPLAGGEDKTIAKFADDIGELRPVVSQARAMSEFLPNERDRSRCYEMGVGWHFQNKARIATGWKPGEEVNAKQHNLFWRKMVDQADAGSAYFKGDDTSPDIAHTLADVRRLQSKVGEVARRDYLPGDTYTGLASAHDALTLAINGLEAVLGGKSSPTPGLGGENWQPSVSLEDDLAMFAEGERVSA